MTEKLDIVLMYGGKSAEHEVSCRSAKSILENLDNQKYSVILCGVEKSGALRVCHDPETVAAIRADHGQNFLPIPADWPIANLAPGRAKKGALWFPGSADSGPVEFDLAFPIIHGPNGEDGRLQGWLEMLGIPFAGSGMYASALCMDKATCKDFLAAHQMPQARYFWFYAREMGEKRREILQRTLELGRGGIFVKPARLGSSVGISKVVLRADAEDYRRNLEKAIELAAAHDQKIVIEEALKIRELEFAVLGNDKIAVAGPGEIEVLRDFYHYDAKYSDPGGSKVIPRANVTKTQAERGMQLAEKAYLLTECRGFARVDTFLDAAGNFLLNEINTLPGFTEISLYPKMWTETGISFGSLLNKIISLARDGEPAAAPTLQERTEAARVARHTD